VIGTPPVRTNDQPQREVIVRWRDPDSGMTFVQLDCEHVEPAPGKDRYRHIRCTQCLPVRRDRSKRPEQLAPMDAPPTNRTWEYVTRRVVRRWLEAGRTWVELADCGHVDVITGSEGLDVVECEQCPPVRITQDGPPPVPRPDPADLWET
jgi:hypothetical protein